VMTPSKQMMETLFDPFGLKPNKKDFAPTVRHSEILSHKADNVQKVAGVSCGV
jgi:hypothetical protein